MHNFKLLKIENLNNLNPYGNENGSFICKGG